MTPEEAEAQRLNHSPRSQGEEAAELGFKPRPLWLHRACSLPTPCSCLGKGRRDSDANAWPIVPGTAVPLELASAFLSVPVNHTNLPEVPPTD